MYTPPEFAETDEVVLYAAMQRYSFATIVSAAGGLPLATLAPVVVGRVGTDRWTVWSHMARANPQWRSFADVDEVLVIFRGPDAYISPAWYTDSPNVPTWNYVVVHAYCRVRLLVAGDPQIHWILEQTVSQYEARFERPWRLDVPDEYFDRLVQGVQGFELEVRRLEGKSKLSQNQAPENRLGVIAGLEPQSDTGAQEIARLMRER